MANNNGLRLLRTCVDHDLVVTNTFKHPDAHTATWLSPGGRYWATKDYILVNRPFWPSVQDTRAMPNALTHDSDHTWWCVAYTSVSPTQPSVDRGYPPSPAYAWHP